MLLHAHFRTLLGLIGVLFCGVATSSAQRGDIRDNGAFFSDTAKAEAGRQTAEIGARFKREVVVETFKSVPDDLKQGVNLQDRAAQNRLFEQWALRQARDLKVNGVYILISKEPSHLQVLVGNETQRTLFQPRDRDALVSAMLAKLRDRKNDAALLEGIGLIATTMKSHVSTRSRAVAQNRPTESTDAETSSPWNWVIAAVLGKLDKGASVTFGESFGEIESVKAVSSLYSPVSGEVIDSNKNLPDNLEWLSQEPFGKAWMLKVKVTAKSPDLLEGAAYDAHCKAEG